MDRTITLIHDQRSIRVPAGSKVETIVKTHMRWTSGDEHYADNPVVALRTNNEILPFGARITVDATIERSGSSPILESDVPAYVELPSRLCERPALSLASAGHRTRPWGWILLHVRRTLWTCQGRYRVAREEMRTIARENFPIELERLSHNAALSYFHQKGYVATELLLSYRNDPTMHLYRCNEFLDIAYEPLLPEQDCWMSGNCGHMANAACFCVSRSPPISCISPSSRTIRCSFRSFANTRYGETCSRWIAWER